MGDQKIDYLDRETLDSLYTIRGMTDKAIGELYNITKNRVCTLRKKFGILGIKHGRKRKYDVGDYDGVNAFERFKVGKLWFFRCVCRCGNYFTVRVTHLGMGKARSCGCALRDAGIAKRTGVGDMTGNYWYNVRKGAESRDLVFDIEKKYAWELYISQGRKCKLSGEPIGFDKPQTASLDRINSDVGYIRGNIQWVHKTVNRMKNNINEEDFILWCKAISKNN